MQAWQTSFDPQHHSFGGEDTHNPTAEKLVNAWQDRLEQSERAGGLLHARFRMIFHAILQSHMTRNSKNAWTAVE